MRNLFGAPPIKLGDPRRQPPWIRLMHIELRIHYPTLLSRKVADLLRPALKRSCDHLTTSALMLGSSIAYIDVRHRQEKKGMKSIIIELRYDLDGEEEAALVEAGKISAKHLYTSAMMLSKRQPEIVMHTAGFFTGKEEIEMADDIQTDQAAEDT